MANMHSHAWADVAHDGISAQVFLEVMLRSTLAERDIMDRDRLRCDDHIKPGSGYFTESCKAPETCS
jgi:hypothetical protein